MSLSTRSASATALARAFSRRATTRSRVSLRAAAKESSASLAHTERSASCWSSGFIVIAPRLGELRSRRDANSPERTGAVGFGPTETPRLEKALDELECGLGHFAPTAVDRERVTTIGHLDELRDAVVTPLALVGCMRHGVWYGIVSLAGDDEQRTAFCILRIDLVFRPRIQIRRCRLEEWCTGRWHGELAIQLACFVLAHSISERVTELVEGQRHSTIAVGGSAKYWPRGLE